MVSSLFRGQVPHLSPEAEQRPFEDDSPIEHVDFQAILVYQGLSRYIIFWLVLWNIRIIFPNSWDDDPIWRTHIFQGVEMVETTNQRYIIFDYHFVCQHDYRKLPCGFGDFRAIKHASTQVANSRHYWFWCLISSYIIHIYIYILWIMIYIYIYSISCCRMKFLNCRWFTHHCW